MDAERIEKGMHVIIANDISKTEAAHSINYSMKAMRGKVFIVEKVEREGYLTVVHVAGYIWDPHDLFEVSPKIEPRIFHFDVKELNI